MRIWVVAMLVACTQARAPAPPWPPARQIVVGRQGTSYVFAIRPAYGIGHGDQCEPAFDIERRTGTTWTQAKVWYLVFKNAARFVDEGPPAPDARAIHCDPPRGPEAHPIDPPLTVLDLMTVSTITWSGRTIEGAAPPGRYRLRVRDATVELDVR